MPGGDLHGCRRRSAKIQRNVRVERTGTDFARRAHAPEGATEGKPAPPATVAQLVDSIDYAVKKIGIDHVGISSDFNHGGGVAGWQNEGEAQNVTVELLRRGYAEKHIAKLWGGNFLRVWGEAQKAAKH
jgi:microsomal dipeptidase-like Zn-dependent dipeptidase